MVASYIVLAAGVVSLLLFVYWDTIIRPRAGKPRLSTNLAFVVKILLVTVTVIGVALAQGVELSEGAILFVLIMAVGSLFHLLIVKPLWRRARKLWTTGVSRKE